MTRFNVLALAGFLSLGAVLTAQTQPESAATPSRTTTIKIQPAGLFVGQYQGSVGRVLNRHISAQLQAGIVYRALDRVGIVDFPISGDGEVVGHNRGGIAVAEIRCYFAGEAPWGAYIAPFGRYRSVKTTVVDDPATTRQRSAFGGGVLFGYQRVGQKSGITFDVFAGPQAKETELTMTGEFEGMEDSAEFGEILFVKTYNLPEAWRVGFAVGYSF